MLVALLAAAAIIALPASVNAHKRSIPATMTAEAQNKNIFRGKLTTVPRCLVGRSVSVFNAGDVFMARATTDGLGNWQAKPAADIAVGSYYALLKPKRILKNRKHKHLCRGGRVDFNAT